MPAPGVGAMCGPCPKGLTGDGEKCNGMNAVYWTKIKQLHTRYSCIYK